MSIKASKVLSDPVNVGLLRHLVAEPRLPTSELARRVGMSAPAVRERVQRMEEAGVIAGYRTELDPKALGYPVAVMIRVRPMPGQLPKIIELARASRRVVECHRITGEDCLLVKMHLECLEMLDTALDEFLAYGQTTTSIIQSSPVPPRGLPLPEVAKTR